jgi:O-antigen ligase
VILLALSLGEALTRSWSWVRTSIDVPLLVLGLAAVASGLLSEWRVTSLALALLFVVTVVVSVRSVAAYAQGGSPYVIRLLLIWIAGGVAAALWGLARIGAGWTFATTPALGENGLGTTLAVALTLTVGLAVTGRLPGRWAAAAISILLAGLILTRARGAWIGAAVGVAWAILAGAPRPARLRLLLGAATLTTLVLIVSARWPALHAEVRSIGSLEANRNRLLIWQAVPRMVADHPLLGTGFGTFLQAYPRYRSPEATELSPPFAHNLLLNFAAETGVVGLVALVALCTVSLLSAWRWAQRSPPSAEGRGPGIAVLAALLALLTNQLFDGSIMSVHLGFGFFALLVLGPLGARTAATGPERTPTQAARRGTT